PDHASIVLHIGHGPKRDNPCALADLRFGKAHAQRDRWSMMRVPPSGIRLQAWKRRMAMKLNVGSADRLIRLMLGVLLILALRQRLGAVCQSAVDLDLPACRRGARRDGCAPFLPGLC